jgi:hypothetical protein
MTYANARSRYETVGLLHLPPLPHPKSSATAAVARTARSVVCLKCSDADTSGGRG